MSACICGNDRAQRARNQKSTTISPIAFEGVRKMDAIFMLERWINGLSPEPKTAEERRVDIWRDGQSLQAGLCAVVGRVFRCQSCADYTINMSEFEFPTRTTVSLGAQRSLFPGLMRWLLVRWLRAS